MKLGLIGFGWIGLNIVKLVLIMYLIFSFSELREYILKSVSFAVFLGLVLVNITGLWWILRYWAVIGYTLFGNFCPVKVLYFSRIYTSSLIKFVSLTVKIIKFWVDTASTRLVKVNYKILYNKFNNHWYYWSRFLPE